MILMLSNIAKKLIYNNLVKKSKHGRFLPKACKKFMDDDICEFLLLNSLLCLHKCMPHNGQDAKLV